MNNQNISTPIPNAAADSQLHVLLLDHFDGYSQKEHDETFIEFVKAIVGPYDMAGKLTPLDTANYVGEVITLLSLVRNVKEWLPQTSENILSTLQAVIDIDLELLEKSLRFALCNLIYQDKGYEGTTLFASTEMINAMNDLNEWLQTAEHYHNDWTEKGGFSC